MADAPDKNAGLSAGWRTEIKLTTVVAVGAFVLSGLNFYRSYLYVHKELEITVTEVSYVTNQGELYMTVAFANPGNRDAAILRVEPALWGHRSKKDAEWLPLSDRVDVNIPVTTPKTPTVVRAGGVEIVTLAAKLDAQDAEEAVQAGHAAAYVGIRVATMDSGGDLYLLHHPVARLVLDAKGRIRSAEPTIHRSLSGFVDLDGAPPGDQLQSNRKTPFVWADEHS